MAVISRIEELVPLLGSVAAADDPLAELERSGHTFSPALRARLQPRAKTSDPRRWLWKNAATSAGNLSFTVGQRPQIVARAVAPGEYEFVAGLRTSAINVVLAGLHASGTITDVIFLDQRLTAGQIDLLQALFIVDRPGGRIGRFFITAPPTIDTIQDGVARVALTIPFRLNFERTLHTLAGQSRLVVTYATGRFRLIVGATSRVVPAGRTERNLEIQIDLSESSGARLELDADSPVQRTNPPAPGAPDGLAIILQNAIQQELADSLRLTVSAGIPLPIGDLAIQRVVVLTRGDAVVVGLKLVGTADDGNPDTLTADFPNGQTNFFTRVHEEVFRLLLKKAVRSGQLTRFAKEIHSDAVIDSADVSFSSGRIQLQMSGRMVDFCPLSVDVGFTVTTTLTFTLDGDRIIVVRDNSRDLDNSDVFLCIVTSLGVALLAAIGIVVLKSWTAAVAAFGIIGLLTVLLEFDGDDLALILDGIFSGSGGAETTYLNLRSPIPGTDLLPTVDGNVLQVDESTLLLAGRLGTRPDTINTYFYVRFLERNSAAHAAVLSQPIPGAVVRLMDRDSPPPAGDDFTLPMQSIARQPGHGVHVVTTTRTRYERTEDEIVRSGVTDHTGRVRFYIPRAELVTAGGNKVVETTRLNVDTGDVRTTIVRTPLSEAHPDFYFDLTRGDGTTIDTLELPGGFFLNFQSARIGTRAYPFTINFAGDHGLVVVFDPGN